MDNYYKIRDLPNGKRLFAFPITFGRARLGIGDPDVAFMDNLW